VLVAGCLSRRLVLPVSRMVSLNARRSTTRGTERGSVNVVVHPLKDSFDAIGTEIFLSFGESLKQQFRAAVTKLVDHEQADALRNA